MSHASSILSSFEPALRERFDRFARLLAERNREVNLTAIDDFEAIRIRHFEDSLAALIVLDRFAKNATVNGSRPFRIIDVGSGAGFPGLALALARPEWRVISLDATGKKIAFQKEAVEALGLENVELIQGRAEDLAHDSNHREVYDAALARALAPLGVLVELTLPLVRPRGCAVAWKGRRVEEEMTNLDRALEALGGGKAEVVPYSLPDENAGDNDAASSLWLVVVPKTGPTPLTYPRKHGAIRKKPLAAFRE